MTKQTITQAIFESANIRHKDADALASVVLVAIRDEIIAKGEFSLPGVGTFTVGPRPHKITKAELTKVARVYGEISRDQASFAADVVMGVVDFIASSDVPFTFFHLGEFAPVESYPSDVRRVVRFKAAPALLAGIACGKASDIDWNDSPELKVSQ